MNFEVQIIDPSGTPIISHKFTLNKPGDLPAGVAVATAQFRTQFPTTPLLVDTGRPGYILKFIY